MLTRYSRTKT